MNHIKCDRAIEQTEVHAAAVQEENDRLHKLVDEWRQGDGHQVCRAELEQLRADLTKSNQEHERHYEAACQLSADLRGLEAKHGKVIAELAKAHAVIALAQTYREAVAAWDTVRDPATPVGALIAGLDAYAAVGRADGGDSRG